MTAMDPNALRDLLQYYGMTELVRLILEVVRELAKETTIVGPPSLAQVIDLDAHRRSRPGPRRPKPEGAA
jgi:hypothetical protein